MLANLVTPEPWVFASRLKSFRLACYSYLVLKVLLFATVKEERAEFGRKENENAGNIF